MTNDLVKLSWWVTELAILSIAVLEFTSVTVSLETFRMIVAIGGVASLVSLSDKTGIYEMD